MELSFTANAENIWTFMLLALQLVATSIVLDILHQYYTILQCVKASSCLEYRNRFM